LTIAILVSHTFIEQPIAPLFPPTPSIPVPTCAS